MKYVGYFRVSTQRQGESGLGLADQKFLVDSYMKDKGELIAEFREIETSRNDNRIQLQKAIALCKKEDAILVIGKIDRLLRKLSLLVTLRAGKIRFVDASSPYATDFEISLRVVFAEEELRKISERTEAAQNQIKLNIDKNGFHKSKTTGNIIFKRGSPVNNISAEIRSKGLEVIKAKASTNENNTRAKAIIKLLKDKMTLQEIADHLNISGFKTSQGCEFSRVQVSRLSK